MNLYSGSTVSSLMKPLFWQRMSPMAFYANYQRQLFLSKSALTSLKAKSWSNAHSSCSNNDFLFSSDGIAC